MDVTRPKELSLSATRLATPAYFPSISSVKTALSPVEYLAILYSLRAMNPLVLVSAFDLARSNDTEELTHWLATMQESGLIVLLDSGNYESYWKNQQESWHPKDFHNAIQRFPYTLTFGFDEQNPPDDLDDHVKLVVQNWQQDQLVSGAHLAIPVIHGDYESLPTLCARVAQETQAPMIAVAERRLGDGVFDRARSVMALREALDREGRYIGLHLLGTGNPISIALYAYAGADSFDGLEWCQTVVDHDSGLLFHLSQADFFKSQTFWGKDDLSFHARTLAHNLAFYTDWMQRLRQALHCGDFLDFCRFSFPPLVFRRCAEAFGWEDATV